MSYIQTLKLYIAIECLEKEAKKSIELAKYYGKIAKKLKEEL